MEIRPIAHIRSDFPEKFGIPRQSGLVESLEARVVFTPEFRNPDALRGVEGFSHLWLSDTQHPGPQLDNSFGKHDEGCRKLGVLLGMTVRATVCFSREGTKSQK